jgi:hypothetical protein
MPYVDSQSAVDALFPDGGRYYWKSHFVDEMSDELIDTLVALDAGRPSPQSVIMIRTPSAAPSAASATTRPPTRRAIAVPFRYRTTTLAEGIGVTRLRRTAGGSGRGGCVASSRYSDAAPIVRTSTRSDRPRT